MQSTPLPKPDAPSEPHMRNHNLALREAKWMLELVQAPAQSISQEAGQEISEQTVENFSQHINAGFLEHRKSATLGGEFAFTEWEGEGSLIRDTLGRPIAV